MGGLFEGSGYFKHFRQRGAISQGRRLIEGRLLLEDTRYLYLELKIKVRSSLRSWSLF